MSTDSSEPTDPNEPSNGEPSMERGIIEMPIEEELKESYLTYAMSVIVSRALPDVRDGLKPSQRRILVAMNDLNLSPGASRVKCAKISGDTSGNYHPHGESVIYPTLVRMAQEWNMRHVLVDKQGNFGSIAGLPPAAIAASLAALAVIVPPALRQGAEFVDDVPDLLTRARETVEGWNEEYTSRIPEDVRAQIEKTLEGGSAYLRIDNAAVEFTSRSINDDVARSRSRSMSSLIEASFSMYVSVAAIYASGW